MDQATFQLLQNYAKEIGYNDYYEHTTPETHDEVFSFLVQLIEAHRYLRREAQKSQLGLHTDLDKIRKMVHDVEMSSTWVKWETLRHMTINQLIEAIGVEE